MKAGKVMIKKKSDRDAFVSQMISEGYEYVETDDSGLFIFDSRGVLHQVDEDVFGECFDRLYKYSELKSRVVNRELNAAERKYLAGLVRKDNSDRIGIEKLLEKLS